MEEFLRVGIITSTHGLKGEVKVYPTTDYPERFEEIKEVMLDTGRGKRMLTIQNVRYFKNQVILKFKEINNINDIEKYKQCELWVNRENGTPLEEGEYYIADLIDCKVYLEDGSYFGTLVDVMETGANDVYVVESQEHGEVLLPAIADCVKEIDIEKGEITVHLMDGLL
ncbi:MAG: ribosome maturation factor RimM [Lachnospiraceae bacterium]|nr:ribosome maturation factor RimM [Lachnospiraceae bacterium]